jgi:hypothetical protein
MKPEYVFIGIVTALELAAASVYGTTGDWRHSIFWTCASIMNVVVTW